MCKVKIEREVHMKEYLVYLKGSGKTNQARIGDKVYYVPSLVRLNEQDIQLAKMLGYRINVIKEVKPTITKSTLPSFEMSNDKSELKEDRQTKEIMMENALSDLIIDKTTETDDTKSEESSTKKSKRKTK